MTNKNVVIISLGCDKNRVDAERMAKSLETAGYQLCGSLESADCAVINTCGFIEAAKEEAISAIFDAVRAKQESSLRAIVVTGCLAQRYCDEIHSEIPEVDAVAGLSLNGDIVSTVENALAGKGVFAAGKPEGLVLEGERKLSTPRHYAYIKIAEGCRHHCTYCAIPMIRGKYRSRAPESIIAEAAELAENGARELILIAQDVTAYGCDLENEDIDLAYLLYKLHDIEGVARIRLLYGYPDGVNERLLAAYRELPKLAKYLDIPLQHSCDRILKLMGRVGDSRMITEVLDNLRATAPKFAVRSTFIAGFPGETAEESDALCEFIKKQGFARSGCFAFSAEEGTAAERLPNQLESGVKTERAERVSRACYEAALAFQSSRVGNVEYAVCDGFDSERGVYLLRGEFDAPDIDTFILVSGSAKLQEGEFYSIKIVSTDEPDVWGEPVDSAAAR